MKAAADKQRPIRPVFVVYEEGHNFAPNGEASISKNITAVRLNFLADQ
jgi:DNA helicase HerA-like ATPase